MTRNDYITEETALIGGRIRDLRKSMGMSQPDFGEAVAEYLGKENIIARTTVSSWENGILPKRSVRLKLAQYFNVPSEHLLLKEEQGIPQKNIDNRYDRIEFAALERMNGEPVWCELSSSQKNTFSNGKYAIVDALHGLLVFSATDQLPFSRINFNIFRCPLPFAFAFDGVGAPLAVSEIIKSAGKVWVEPVGLDFETRQQLKGWGMYDAITNAVVCDSGTSYMLKDYEKRFVCFRQRNPYPEDKIDWEVYRATPDEG